MASESAETAESPCPFVITLPGVYAPQHDTQLLMVALDREHVAAGADVLDLGTGSGALAVRAAQLGGRVTAVDIARCAVATTRLNALLHRQRITVRHSDLASAMQDRRYDLILCNPPYVLSAYGLSSPVAYGPTSPALSAGGRPTIPGVRTRTSRPCQ
ncbi:methyltransferase [Streptomyces sp. NPDC002205]|uniref:methyltransferase n=1 Tax=Streptomyces sp. NPDC002205 TaxID=3154411 RepID=UPI00331BEDDC